MRKAWWMVIAALSAPAIGCSASSDETARADGAYTTGGEGKPVGPSRVARPLPEAGPRVNYPEPRSGVDAFDLEADRNDPMMEDPATGAPACPADMSALEIDVTDVYDGAAIVLTGDLSSATTIQASARQMAARQTGTDASAATETETAATEASDVTEAGMAKPEELTMPGVRSEVVDLARGARVSYYAVDPADVTTVRNMVRRLAAAMRDGSCAVAP